MSPLLITFLFTSSVVISGSNSYDYEAHIVGIFLLQSELHVNLEVVKPVLELAVKESNQLYPHIMFTLVFRNGSTSCSANFAGVFAAEEYYRRRVTAFVGPACSLALDPVGRMAAYWNVPAFTAGGIDSRFADKTTFSTLTRLSFSLDSAGDFIIEVLREFDWKHIAVIVEEANLQSVLLKHSLVSRFKHSDYSIFLSVKELPVKTEINYTKVLTECNAIARVFIVLTSKNVLHQILFAAYEMGMSNGEHAFLSVELIKNPRSADDFSWNTSSNGKMHTKIYEALKVVSVRHPTNDKYKQLVKTVTESSTTESGIQMDASMVNPVIAAFYDCVLMYASAVNETLAEGYDPSNGYVLSRRMWNKTFTTGLTGSIYINDNGDREADYTLNDMDPITGTLRPVATYFGIRKIYERIEGVDIHWPGKDGRPPLDVPLCGLRGEEPHCQESVPLPLFISIGVCVLCLALISVTAGFIMYRKMKLESNLADLWWKVRWEDIIFIDQLGFKSLVNMRATDHTDKQSLPSLTDLSTLREARVSGVAIGVYKRTKVAVKCLNVKKLVITRPLLLEMKQMRELAHENIVRFIGMCMDEPNIVVLTELSPRGSLQDIIENGSINIDWVFRYAMISDIVEGMTFLHGSVIGYHGKLKSANCVIDGRFVVKITDYGIRTLYNQIIDDGSITNPGKLFWTAPEHLRSSFPEKEGSKKGDVYSFSIILQEIITRTGPFKNLAIKELNYEPMEILEKVKLGSKPPFRPEVSPEEGTAEILELMQRCWVEQPEERPTFHEIKIQLKQITKGISSRNFLDNLLSRMEQYANNLEQMVEEKTQSLIDEKKKTEELLYQLLPKYVADELKKGRHVKPEAFESVTIFFSDVVGFTPLAAESTPMQVVDLLNDLYTCFDDIIENYNVYKVETIGDAYMVVSGLPIRNGNEHAREIALMSLSLLRAINGLKVRHRNDRKLQIRIGVHSGPCAAGVVGFKMPRYCLFGDTVNTASRMESNGQAMKIHVSNQTKCILDIFGTFKIALRGDIEIKGKGIMRTYWLEGEKGNCHVLSNE